MSKACGKVLIPPGPGLGAASRAITIVNRQSTIVDRGWRTGRDSNPRYSFEVRTFSKGVLSTTQPPIHGDSRRAEVEHSGGFSSTIAERKSQACAQCLNGQVRNGVIEDMRIHLLLGVSLLTSCSLFNGDDEQPVESESAPRLVGRIDSVSAEKDFVLIESYGPWRVAEGSVLTGSGDEGRTCNLVVTGEKLGQHAAADIRSGVAKVGDSVYYRPLGAESGSGNEISVESPASAAALPEIETQNNADDLPASQ